MITSLFDRARAERFAQLLEEAGGGRRHHTRSRLDRELAQPVEISRKLNSMHFDVAPTPRFKAELRAQLIATAHREGLGAKAQAKRRKLREPVSSTRPRARGAIIVGIAAGTLALSGVSVASGEAIPGDTLYGMKRSTERAQLALAGSDVNRGQLYLDFARTRLQEAHAVRSAETSFIGSLRDMDNDTLQGVRTLVTSAMNQRDTGALDAVDRFARGQRLLVADLLRVIGTAAGQSKVTESLTLLMKIEERARLARTALGCGATSTAGDTFGPIPGSCGGSARSQPAATGNHRPTQQPQPGTAGSSPAVGTQSPTASPTAAVQEPEKQRGGGLLDKLGRILSRLLG